MKKFYTHICPNYIIGALIWLAGHFMSVLDWLWPINWAWVGSPSPRASFPLRSITLFRGQNLQTLVWFQTFFSNPRTILIILTILTIRINVNLQRNFFGGWGYGYLGKITQKSIGMHHLQPSNLKNSLGEDPQTPLQETICSWVPLTIRMHPPSSLALRAVRTFHTFFAKTHSDPLLLNVF